jgi:hypothetical protein
MHESAALTHPALATALIVAALLGCALVLPSRSFPRRTLVTAALVMSAGLVAASALAWWNGRGAVMRTGTLMHASLASTALLAFATTPPMGGRWCGSSAGVIVGAFIMAIAMVVSEFL